ncbi:MAG: hypothetical protein EXR54_07170 [Dehalococcoidia bacterium]|nr:hypothetical protein [Dehalococcoidia bacterium]MSQ17331.1 hypothetical protein [Dehalococcoidia bacterium]
MMQRYRVGGLAGSLLALLLALAACGGAAAPELPATPAALGKKGVLQFRYTNEVFLGQGLTLEDFPPGAVVNVLPGQRISEEFLNQQLEIEGGQPVYGRTQISFDPANPKVAGLTFEVASVTRFGPVFTQPFPELMRNRWNSFFPFTVEVFPPR